MNPKVCILAGGLGTRLSEETGLKPKPMVEIGGKPMLWHIMKLYSAYGFGHFMIALGYKSEVIKDYFLNFTKRSSDLSIELSTGQVWMSNNRCDPWTVDLIDTGLHTHTGGRVRQICHRLGDGTFMMTYGDGLCDVDLRQVLAFHRSHGKLATVTAVRPPARFGAISFTGDVVSGFHEKPTTGEGWINGGFFVLDARVAKYIDSDDMPFETEPLRRLAEDGQLVGYRHEGFWQCMDTLRDVRALEQMWNDGAAPWRVWDKNVDTVRESDEPTILAGKEGPHHRSHGV